MTTDTIVAQATAPAVVVSALSVYQATGCHVAQTVTGRTLRPRYAEYLPFTDEDGQQLDQGIALFSPILIHLPVKMCLSCKVTVPGRHGYADPPYFAD